MPRLRSRPVVYEVQDDLSSSSSDSEEDSVISEDEVQFQVQQQQQIHKPVAVPDPQCSSAYVGPSVSYNQMTPMLVTANPSYETITGTVGTAHEAYFHHDMMHGGASNYSNINSTSTYNLNYNHRTSRSPRRPKEVPSRDNEAVVCKLCNKEFGNLMKLKKHLKTHIPFAERPFQCEQCDKRFPHRWGLNRHVKESHDKLKRERGSRTGEGKAKGPDDFKCDICQKSFNHKQSLTRHKRSHYDDKPHECEVCHKRFVQASDVNRHRRTHTGEKPFPCNQCDRAFTQSANLQRHLQYHETLKEKKIVYGRNMNIILDPVDYTQQLKLKSDTHSSSSSSDSDDEDDQDHPAMIIPDTDESVKDNS